MGVYQVWGYARCVVFRRLQQIGSEHAPCISMYLYVVFVCLNLINHGDMCVSCLSSNRFIFSGLRLRSQVSRGPSRIRWYLDSVEAGSDTF